MIDPHADLAHRLLDAARAAGADAADAIVIAGESLSVDLHRAALDRAERAERVEYGLRVLVGQGQACISASDIRAETLATLAERAVAMAGEAPPDPYCGLAEPAALARSWDLDALALDAPGPSPDPALLEEMSGVAEAAALAVPGVTQVDGVGASWGRTHVHLAATNGFSGGYVRSAYSLYCTAIVGGGLGMERDYAGESRVFFDELPPPREVGTLAGTRAVERFGARKPPTGAYPVLFDERVAASLIGHLTAAINGSAVARGASWLKDAMDERVLPAGMSLTEEPTRPRTAGSRPFDGEGLPVATRLLVEDGTLRGWTLDLATGRQLGLPSTGNAMRGTGGPPGPGAGNLRLTQGHHSREDLIRDMGTGLIVTSMLGASINPTTGDYSRGAAGFWVEGGQILHPVNECTIAGNLRAMLLTLIPANDARQHLSRVVPSLLVEGLTLAGG